MQSLVADRGWPLKEAVEASSVSAPLMRANPKHLLPSDSFSLLGEKCNDLPRKAS